jgi:hypothetical protein
VQRSSGVGVGRGLAAGETEPKLQDPAIKIIQPEQQFPYGHPVRQNFLELITSLQPVERSTVDQLQ